MTTPQVIHWTHVDDQAPPVLQRLCLHAPQRPLYFDVLFEPILDARMYYSFTHWAIIAPPSTTTAAQTNEQ